MSKILEGLRKKGYNALCPGLHKVICKHREGSSEEQLEPKVDCGGSRSEWAESSG